MTAPLFIFGVARSGTNLVARMLDAHPGVAIALDPLMPLLRLWRNLALARAAADTGHAFDPAAPFQDGYFATSGAWHIDAIRDAPADLPIPSDAFASLGEAVAARAGLESQDLAKAFAGWEGGTIRERLENALAVIAAARRLRGQPALAFAGSKEVWTIEFTQSLARALPEARFVVLHRDPRAVIASLVELGRRDPSQAAHVVSYLRHWRKHVAVSHLLENCDALAGRLLVLRVRGRCGRSDGPRRAAVRLPRDPFRPGDARTGRRDLDRKQQLRTPGCAGGFRRQRALAALSRSGSDGDVRGVLRSGDGASSDTLTRPGASMAPSAAETLRAGLEPGSWRSDSGDTIADLAWEALRGRMLADPDSDWPAGMVRRCFLFESGVRGAGASRAGGSV